LLAPAVGISIEKVTKVFANGHVAVRDISLQVTSGEFLVLVGPSGCGKSTLLRLLAGLDAPSSGRIGLDGIDVTDVPPQRRDIAMVFQSYALYPHLSVRDNLAYALKVRRMPQAEIDRRITDVSTTLGIDALLERRPAQLSGGQRQRVALGRAIVRDPKAFLFDEPLSNLDPALRSHARAELRRLHQRLAATIVYVTHDQEEAMTLGDRIVVMRDGTIEQTGTPLEIYQRPANEFVARFVGSPPMNLIPAEMAGVPAPEGCRAGIRPQDATLHIDDVGALRGTVDLVEPRGHDSLVHVRLGADRHPFVAVVSGAPPRVGTTVSVVMRPEAIHLFAGDGTRIE
jgi:multiple sugar transport system ATP-binding protein